MGCPACKSNNVTKYDATLSECGGCQHAWETSLTVKANYDKEYVADRYDKYDTTEAMSHLRLGLVKSLAVGGKLLDVGYGNGSFVKLACKAGFDAYGNDVHGADYGVKEARLDGSQLWDVVTFFDSLEHFPDLNVIRELSQRAKYVVVSFPTRPAGFPARAENWRHYRPGEHLHYFTLTSLMRLLGKSIESLTDMEDVIRGRRAGESNITTAVLGLRVSRAIHI